jgi:hypothetical protein
LPVNTHTVSVIELVVAYTEFATGYYRKDGRPTNEVRMIKAAIKIARELYGRTPATEFGPLALQAVREAMIGKGWCRTVHVNHDRNATASPSTTATSVVAISSLRQPEGLARAVALQSSRPVCMFSNCEIVVGKHYPAL